MYEYQYLIGGALSLLMSLYILIKRPKTLALRFFFLFGMAVTLWEMFSFLSITAPDGNAAATLFAAMMLFTQLSFPLYLLTILNIQKRNLRFSLFVLIPATIEIVLFREFLKGIYVISTPFGWSFGISNITLPFAVYGIFYVGYIVAIIGALVDLRRKTAQPLLKRKYSILLISYVLFQTGGTILTNALLALGFLGANFRVGGVLHFLSFLSIWYALSLKEREIPLSIAGRDFSQIYASFLTVYYNSIVGSHLGEEAFKFTEFVRESKIESRVTVREDEITFSEVEGLDVARLVSNNLVCFARDSVDDYVVGHYLRVLNAAARELGWRFGEAVRANEEFLKRTDLIYGISEGRFLKMITEDASLHELDDLDACLKIYKRILLPIIGKLIANTKLRAKLSEYHVTEAIRISDYGEISIDGVRERLLEVPKGDRLQVAIERFNSVLGLTYEELLMDPDADVEGILEKLTSVLTLNKDRAIALGVYPTLLGMLATKIPRRQTHRLYSDFLEELVEERTRELEEAQDSLLKTQRLAVIGEAAAMVGHDLRNPLQAIVNALYLAGKRLASSPDRDLGELLGAISGQVEYMNKIVSDLQDYARPLKPKPAETALHELLNETLSAVRVPEDIKVSIEVEGDLNFPKLMVDPQLMKRVLINLIINALQAMPDGGQLRIKASKTEEAALISLQDTGIGIPEEHLDKIFQPLFTTKAKGQGLGLAVCKRLVEAHGGRITVENTQGKGATFTIEIPTKSERHLEKTSPRQLS